MKALSLIGILVLGAACNNAAPTATSYKEQLGAPASVTGTQGSSNAAAGDPAKGKTALAACTGCHAAGGIAHALVAADAASIESGKAASNAGHGPGLADTFKNSGKDIAAHLKAGTTTGTGTGTPAAAAGDAVKGEALLKAQCEICHKADGTGTGPTLDQFSGVDAQLPTSDTKAAAHSAEVTDAIGKNTNDIKAALKARQ